MIIRPVSGEETNIKRSAMNYYSYRSMIRQNEDNHILKCRQLLHQYIIDMYARVETERLMFISFNQTTLRSEEYVNLGDAVVNCGNTTNIERLITLPSSYTSSPRHMLKMQMRMLVTTGVQTYSLHSHAIQLGKT